MINLTILYPCPSIQSNRIGTELMEWRKYICEEASHNSPFEFYEKPDDGIRYLVKTHLSGSCKIRQKFYFKKTNPKNVPDLDNMSNFIASCFKTEETEESIEVGKEIEEAGFVPWFYFTLFWYPYDMNVQSVHAEKVLGADQDKTEIAIELIPALESA